jgi:hypothetical protein
LFNVEGVGGNSHCVNVTYPNGTTGMEKEKLAPRFSVEVKILIFNNSKTPYKNITV